MTHNLRIIVWVCAVTLALLAGPGVSWGQDIEWIRQFGTTNEDYAHGVATDVSGVYVAGWTYGAFPGQTSAGNHDAFVCKYDIAGTQLWCRQFGSVHGDLAFDVASDASGVYVAGWTGGTVPGQTNAGSFDAFVCKYDPDGNLSWCRQFGTPGWDQGWAVASDASGVYVAGDTWEGFPGQPYVGNSDAFVCKFDPDGNPSWCRQFGTTSWDYGRSVASDASGVYVGGHTYGYLAPAGRGNVDAFVCKYDPDGNESWCHQFGTIEGESAEGVTNYASGIYVVGATGGAFPGQTNAGSSDAFVCQYDTEGNQAWCRQFGTSGEDLAPRAASDPSAVYIAGSTGGTLPGQTRAGLEDAFVCHYDHNGTQLWCRQFGTGSNDTTRGVASGVYVAGYTSGTFPGQTSAGNIDAFVVKLGPANEVPTAEAGPDQTVIAGESVMFDGTGSYDPDGTIVSFDWAFGDGGSVNGAIVGHLYGTAGSFTATLTVTDDDGATDDDTAAVTVLSTAQAIGALSDLVASFNFQQGISNSLDAKLDNALEALQAANAGQRQDAANKLEAFINAVNAQRGKEITDAQADALIALAMRILAVI